MADEQADAQSKSIELATELTVAWLSNPNVRASAEEVPAFLRKMYETIGDLAKVPETDAAPAAPEYVPAVPIRSSVKPDYIVSLIDGRKFKSLKRHLSSQSLTPQQYRERFGLKPDYPMVAANYSAHRREVARKLGLGRKPRTAIAKAAAPAAATVAETAATDSAASKHTAKAARKTASPKPAVAKPPRTPRVKKAAESRRVES